MPLSDNDLLDFDASGLAMADAGDARALLREHGDVFRTHLVAARWFEGWLRRRQKSWANDIIGPRHSEDHEEGFAEATRDMVAHLRQGDFLPGGRLYEDEINRRFADD